MSGRVVGKQMRAYYDRSAAEYDDWWQGSGLLHVAIGRGGLRRSSG